MPWLARKPRPQAPPQAAQPDEGTLSPEYPPPEHSNGGGAGVIAQPHGAAPISVSTAALDLACDVPSLRSEPDHGPLAGLRHHTCEVEKALLTPAEPHSRPDWQIADEALERLRDSLYQEGVQQPLICAPLRDDEPAYQEGRRLRIIDGHRRFGILDQMPIKRVPVTIVRTADGQAPSAFLCRYLWLHLTYTTKKPSLVQATLGFRLLRMDWERLDSRTQACCPFPAQRGLAKLLGVSLGTINKAIWITQEPAMVQHAFLEGQLSEAALCELREGFPDPQAREEALRRSMERRDAESHHPNASAHGKQTRPAALTPWIRAELQTRKGQPSIAVAAQPEQMPRSVAFRATRDLAVSRRTTGTHDNQAGAAGEGVTSTATSTEAVAVHPPSLAAGQFAPVAARSDLAHATSSSGGNIEPNEGRQQEKTGAIAQWTTPAHYARLLLQAIELYTEVAPQLTRLSRNGIGLTSLGQAMEILQQPAVLQTLQALKLGSVVLTQQKGESLSRTGSHPAPMRSPHTRALQVTASTSPI